MKNKSAPFGWCFIGTGTLANQVASQVVKSGRHEVVSCYTRRAESGEKFTSKHGGYYYAKARDAINADGVDAVYVVTTHDSHYEYAKLALECGKPVLVEKPFTMTAEEAKELVELARKKGLYIAEAMWTWYGPVANQIKEWVDSGEYGELKNVAISYCMNSKGYADRVTNPMKAGGALLDVGVYPVTYLYRLFGKPERITCKGKMKNGVDLADDICMDFGDGRTVSFRASVDDFRGFETLKLEGTEGSTKLLLWHAAGKATLKKKRGKDLVVKGSGNYLNEFDVVANEIRLGYPESRFVPLQCTVDVMELLDECRKQMGLVYPFETLKKGIVRTL